MKNKYTIAFFIALIIVIVGINWFQPYKEQKVKGSIEIFVDENSYDYLTECAEAFMKINDKTFVTVQKLSSYKNVNDIVELANKKYSASIIQISRCNFQNLQSKNLGDYADDSELLNTYSKNFSQYRVDQVKTKEKVIGIPLNSRPLAFYVRQDILSQYGYDRADMNTWDDVIKIGKVIYSKSKGRVKTINATGQDYKDLVDLLTMQTLNEDKTVDQITKEVQSKIKELKDNNILNLKDGGEFLGRISSINAMKELMGLKQSCEWSCGNVPSLDAGANKFFAAEGDNLVVLNQNNENKKLIERFITYVITNNKNTVKYVKQGKFFSSYLYAYRGKEIEDSVQNFVGNSPLVVLNNIEERTPAINYDRYIKVKKQLEN